MSSGSYSETCGDPENYARYFRNSEKQLNRNALLKQGIFVKILPWLRYLTRPVLTFRGHGYDKDSNFKQLLNFRVEDALAFAEWLKKKKRIKPKFSLKFKIKY